MARKILLRPRPGEHLAHREYVDDLSPISDSPLSTRITSFPRSRLLSREALDKRMKSLLANKRLPPKYEGSCCHHRSSCRNSLTMS